MKINDYQIVQANIDNRYYIFWKNVFIGEDYNTLKEARERVIDFICFPLVRMYPELLNGHLDN